MRIALLLPGEPRSEPAETHPLPELLADAFRQNHWMAQVRRGSRQLLGSGSAVYWGRHESVQLAGAFLHGLAGDLSRIVDHEGERQIQW